MRQFEQGPKVHTDISMGPDDLKAFGRVTQSLAESNRTRCWLLPEEEEVILEFALENASRGWPLSKERIKAHVDKIY